MKGSSMIREMFEEGNRRIATYGAENVFDFSIGNPVFEPPPEVKAALLSVVESAEPGKHRYMSNAGFPETRGYLAEMLSKETGLAFDIDDLIMTTGAGGALNVIVKSLLDPGEDVIVLKPYFMEYSNYIANHGGSIKTVAVDDRFRIDLQELELALSPSVKAVLINSPNNPTGVVYSKEELEALGQLLTEKSREFGSPISLISDEPYKAISFDVEVPSIFKAYTNAIVATSYSKDLAIPGERIGYLAISPQHEDRVLLRGAAVLALRTLGFVNAPAIWQRVIPLVGKATVDIEPYRRNRDLLFNHLTSLGFDAVKPEGGFYLFPKSPVPDDLAFVHTAMERNLLLVPGGAFGTPGYFRISFCFPTEMIERSLPKFEELAGHYSLV